MMPMLIRTMSTPLNDENHGVRLKIEAGRKVYATNCVQRLRRDELSRALEVHEVAMETEMKSLNENDVWDLVELPPGQKTVGSKCVFKKKIGADGSVQARLVAQGYTQKYGTDLDETFCPVVRQESLHLLIALPVQHGLKLHQVDVATAFLNGTLEEEVFMKQPEGFEVKGKEHLVCRLKKSIYGLKQSPRNTALDNQLNRFVKVFFRKSF